MRQLRGTGCERGPATGHTGHSTFYCSFNKPTGHETHELLPTVAVSFKATGHVPAAPPAAKHAPHPFGHGETRVQSVALPPAPRVSTAVSRGTQRWSRPRTHVQGTADPEAQSLPAAAAKLGSQVSGLGSDSPKVRAVSWPRMTQRYRSRGPQIKSHDLLILNHRDGFTDLWPRRPEGICFSGCSRATGIS